jgi:hypothetical protein
MVSADSSSKNMETLEMIDDALVFDESFLGGSIEIEDMFFEDASFVSLANDDAETFAKASSESQEEETWVQEMLSEDEDDTFFAGCADCSCRIPETVAAAAPHDDTTVATVVSTSSAYGNSVQGEDDSLHTDSTPTQGSGRTQESSSVSSLQKTREKLDECMKQSARSRSLIGSFLRKTPRKQEESVFLIRSIMLASLPLPSLSKSECQNTASGTTHKESAPAKKERSGSVRKCRIGGAHMPAANTSKKNMLKMIDFASSGLGKKHFLAGCSSAKVKTTGVMFRSASGGTSSLARIMLPAPLPTPQSRCYRPDMKTTAISDFLRVKGNTDRVQHVST